jgi:hypothetical protein
MTSPDQIFETLAGYGLSPDQIAKVVDLLNNTACSNSIQPVVDDLFSKALTFWLLTNSLP